jgi:hypothetical protein
LMIGALLTFFFIPRTLRVRVGLADQELVTSSVQR